MARHLSAMKRARQNKKRRVRNQSRKTRVKNVVREVRQALNKQDAASAETALTKAIPIIAQVAGKGTYEVVSVFCLLESREEDGKPDKETINAADFF